LKIDAWKFMVILGLDPGIADTGYGVIETGRSVDLKCLAYGSIKTPAKMPLPERLAVLHQELGRIIATFQPQSVCVEELFFAKNAKTALIVGQARGVILLTCQEAGLQISSLTPLQIKQAVATYGGADKRQVQKMVQMILNLKEIPKPDDAADALAAAVAGVGLQYRSR
jgi:crossover junction endodeoxyribonuclease RuvC